MITAVYPIRQREEHHRSWDRLEMSIVSLQRFMLSVSDIFLIDAHSDERFVAEMVKLARDMGVSLFRAQEDYRWNKCRTMNSGMKLATTPYLMQVDMDMIVTTPKADAVAKARLDPGVFLTYLIYNLSAVVTLDDICQRPDKELHAWALEHSKLRSGGRSTGGIQIFHRDWFYDIRGYDEGFSLWGREDDDMVRRAERTGIVRVHDQTPIFHIGHPSSQKAYDKDGAQMRANAKRYNREGIYRNPESSWGDIPLAPLVWRGTNV